MSPPVTDLRDRPLHDLRISVTDRCNFRCRYCMPREAFGPGHAFLGQAEVLQPEEIERLTRIMVGLGVRRVRLTGGEPLLRPDLPDVARRLGGLGLDDLALTTNGVLLARRARALRDASIRRVTVSLDSLRQSTFSAMADSRVPVDDVIAGIDAAVAAGLTPVRVNTVVKRGVNDGEIEELVAFAVGRSLCLRFIEFMEVGETNGWRRDLVVDSADIRRRIERTHTLLPLEPRHDGEVARRFAVAGTGAEIGFISSVSEPFCSGCSRARLTADGRLVTCLFATAGLDLRGPMRAGAADDDLRDLIAGRWQRRTDAYSENPAAAGVHKLEMSYVGG